MTQQTEAPWWKGKVEETEKGLLVAKARLIDDESGDMLLMRRSKTATRPGEWDAPGGFAAVGENEPDVQTGRLIPLRTIIREVGEETGFDVDQANVVVLGDLIAMSIDGPLDFWLFEVRVQGREGFERSREHDQEWWGPIERGRQMLGQSLIALD